MATNVVQPAKAAAPVKVPEPAKPVEAAKPAPAPEPETPKAQPAPHTDFDVFKLGADQTYNFLVECRTCHVQARCMTDSEVDWFKDSHLLRANPRPF